jgi:hypothetical protein
MVIHCAGLSDPPAEIQSTAFHCLVQVQLRKHRTLFDGAISPYGNMIALLSKGGSILPLPLLAGNIGGIVTNTDHGPIELDRHLAQQTFIDTAAVRFSADGKQLFAIDHEGKVVVATFTGIPSLPTRPVPSSPAPALDPDFSGFGQPFRISEV